MAHKYAIQKAMKYKNLDKLEIVTHKIRNKKRFNKASKNI